MNFKFLNNSKPPRFLLPKFYTSISKIPQIIIFFLTIYSCKSLQYSDEKLDFTNLKQAITRVSRHKDYLEKREIESLKNLKLKTKKFVKIRDDCYSAYYNLFLAKEKSNEASSIIQKLENSATHLKPQEIIELKNRANSLLQESDHLLDNAKNAQENCHRELLKFESSPPPNQ